MRRNQGISEKESGDPFEGVPVDLFNINECNVWYNESCCGGTWSGRKRSFRKTDVRSLLAAPIFR